MAPEETKTGAVLRGTMAPGTVGYLSETRHTIRGRTIEFDIYGRPSIVPAQSATAGPAVNGGTPSTAAATPPSVALDK